MKILLFLITVFFLGGCKPQSVPVSESTITPSITITPTITRTPIPTREKRPSDTPQPPTATMLSATNRPHHNSHPKTGYYFESYPNEGLSIYEPDNPEPIFNVNQMAYFTNGKEPPHCFYADRYRIYDPQWSPSGRYLAYIGAIKSPYTDLYVYDIPTRVNRRLTDGEDYASFPWWSPNNEWIVFSDVNYCSSHEKLDEIHKAVWAIKPDGSEVKWLFDPVDDFWVVNWVDGNRFYSAESSGPGIATLRFINIGKKEVILVIDWIFLGYPYTIDPESGSIAWFIFHEDPIVPKPTGVYLTTPWTPTLRMVIPFDGDYSYEEAMIYWDEEQGLFVTPIQCEEGENLSYAFNPNGEITCVKYLLDTAHFSIDNSPNPL